MEYQAKYIFDEDENEDEFNIFNSELIEDILRDGCINQIEIFYKNSDYPDLDKFDKKANKFSYYDLIEFAEQYANRKIRDFAAHLNTYKGQEDIRFDFMVIDFLNIDATN